MASPSGHIAGIRTDYRKAVLDEATAGEDPLAFFSRWFSEAEEAAADEVNAMTLATVDAAGHPHARIVLLKGLDDQGFVFFTNYSSDKGQQIASNDSVALVFFWKELERQVRVEGKAELVSAGESDQYFRSRPLGSRIGAWASPQSQVLPGREVLEDRYAQVEQEYEGKDLPRPEFWGGYRIVPQRIEFWQGRSSRLHDRIVFEREDKGWKKFRLAP